MAETTLPPALPSYPPIALTGRTSAWQRRVPAGSAEQALHREPRPEREAPRLLSTWLHHSAYGMIGVYVPESQADHWERERRRLLVRSQWVHLTGIVRPYYAVALPDDPRSSQHPTLCPLAVEIIQLEPAPQRHRLAPQVVARPCVSRILPRGAASTPHLLPLAQWPDAVYWGGMREAPMVNITWNTIRGIVTAVDGIRFMRYVVAETANAAPTPAVPAGVSSNG